MRGRGQSLRLLSAEPDNLHCELGHNITVLHLLLLFLSETGQAAQAFVRRGEGRQCRRLLAPSRRQVDMGRMCGSIRRSCAQMAALFGEGALEA